MSAHKHDYPTIEAKALRGGVGGAYPHFLRPGIMMGDYEVQDVVAITQTSEVGRAIDQETGDLVALKVPRTMEGVKTIRHETLVHHAVGRQSFIAAMVGSGVLRNELPFIATRMQEKGTLADVARDVRIEYQPDVQRSIKLMGHCAFGIGTLHAAGFVHRDIKPANIGVDLEDTGRLIDLGIAEHPADRVTVEAIWGTPGESIALEGYRGVVSPRGDIWAHAVTSYHTLTGVSPFEVPEEKTIFGYHYMASRGPLRAPRDLNANIPSDVDRVITEALHPDPSKRPTIQEVQSVYDRAA